MTIDLVGWLRAQLDHDEQVARAASRPYPYADEGSKAPEDGVRWRWVTGEHWETVRPDPVVDEFVAPAGEPCWLATVEEWPSTSRLDDGTVIRTHMMPLTYADSIVEMDASAGLHIALHDPARVLRQVAAHRAILDRHAPLETGYCAFCWGHAYQETGWPCADVLSVASIYSDRPGFDPSWTAAP